MRIASREVLDLTLALEDRDGLPDALRILLDAYPRQGWTQDPGFDELIQFWLERHQMFRKLLATMTSETQALLDDIAQAPHFAAATARYGGMFVNGLHEHHHVEDDFYFPRLRAKAPQIDRGFDILDKDHHALDRHLSDFVSTANDMLSVRDAPEKLKPAADNFLTQLEVLTGLLNRHLIDEEELIVPIILKFGAPDLG